MKRILRARALVALLVAQSLGGPLLAQSNQIGATISGTVVDAQGGTVQSATVSLAKEGDSQPFLSIRTDAGGIFRFPAVEAGTYRLSISAKGFEEFARIIETSRDAGSELEITMRVSGAHQSVTITELGPYVTPDATSATKQDTPIMETPVSVHVVPAAVLRDQQAVSLQTAIQNISGVIQSNDSYGTGDSFVIRGFDQRQTTYEDGLRLDQYTNFGLPQDLANIELVEVVKGPESVLYGQAEPGGLVNAVTKKPQDAPAYEFQQQLGSYGFYRTTAGATGPLAAHRLFYRIDLDYAKAGSFRNFIHSDHFSIFPSVQWRPSGRDQLTFSFYFGKGTLVSDNGIPFLSNGTPANVPLSRNFADPGVNRDPIREYYFKLLASHSLTDKWKVRIAYKSQYTDAPTPNFQAYIGDADPTGNLTLFAFTESYSNHWTHQAVTDITGEFGTFGIHHNVIAGFDFYDDYGGYDANTYLPPSINIFAPVWNQPYQLPDPWTNFVVANGETAYGAYIQDQVNLKHHMHLLAGLRFDRVHTYDTGFGQVSEARDRPKPTPRAGILWQPYSYLSVYGSYTGNYGATALGALTIAGKPLPPQSAQQYEAGIKTQWLQKRLTASAAVYQITKHNVPAADPSNPLYSIAIGEARSRGIEFDVTGQISAGLSIVGGYSYIHALTLQDPSTPSLAGLRFPGVPYDSGSLWAVYDFQEHRKWKGFRLGAGVLARSGELAWESPGGVSYQADRIPGFAIVNAMAAYGWQTEKEHFTLQVNANNLLNKAYFAAVNPSQATPGAPFSIMPSLKVQF